MAPVITYGKSRDGKVYYLQPNDDESFQAIEVGSVDEPKIINIKDLILVTNDLEEARQYTEPDIDDVLQFSLEKTLNLDTIEQHLIESYQCPGCVYGSDVGCGYYKQHSEGIGCGAHRPGTIMPNVGIILIGLPNGFNRIGNIDIDTFRLFIYTQNNVDWKSNKFQVPVWKHLDKNGNTLFRGFLPRLNQPILYIVEGDARHLFDCVEITEDDIKGMD